MRESGRVYAIKFSVTFTAAAACYSIVIVVPRVECVYIHNIMCECIYGYDTQNGGVVKKYGLLKKKKPKFKCPADGREEREGRKSLRQRKTIELLYVVYNNRSPPVERIQIHRYTVFDIRFKFFRAGWQ